MYENPFEERKELEIKIMHLEEQIRELEENIGPIMKCLEYYSKQHNGHYAKEIFNLVTTNGH
jgi:hypothetical protein